MIYIGCGVIMFVIGVIWLIAPSPNPNRIYGYMSYLASVNEASYKYAQKPASELAHQRDDVHERR